MGTEDGCLGCSICLGGEQSLTVEERAIEHLRTENRKLHDGVDHLRDEVEALREQLATSQDAAEKLRSANVAMSELVDAMKRDARQERDDAWGEAVRALGEGWLAGGVGLAEGIRRKTTALARLVAMGMTGGTQ